LLPKTVESRLGISTSSIVKKNCGSPVTVGLNWLVFGELVLRLVDFRWIFGALGTPPLREFGFLTGPVILGLCSRLMGGFFYWDQGHPVHIGPAGSSGRVQL
jgi:hypothetical protein